jgi:hypothetical protein
VDDLIEAGMSARENQPEWTYWLDHDEADVMAARCATRLGRASTAVPLIQAALGRYSTGHRREMALYWSFLAEAHLRAGQLADAADAVASAAGYAAGTASARVTTRISSLQRALGINSAYYWPESCRQRNVSVGWNPARLDPRSARACHSPLDA